MKGLVFFFFFFWKKGFEKEKHKILSLRRDFHKMFPFAQGQKQRDSQI